MTRIYGVFLIGMVGCASAPPKENDVDLTEVKPVDAAAQAEDYANAVIRQTLKDPDSMQFSSPNELEIQHCTNGAGGNFRIWQLTVGINAKNSFGGFTGAQPYRIYFVGFTDN